MSVTLLLKFANYDSGSRSEVEVPLSMTVRELKTMLMEEHWPAQGVTPVRTIDDFRLICQGKLLSDGSKTLEASGVPRLSFATPLHIAVSPSAIAVAAGKPDPDAGCCAIQ